MPLEALCLQKPPHLLPEDPEGTVTSLNMGHLTWVGRPGESVLERMDGEVKGQRESG